MLKAVREGLGMTREEMAVALGTSATTIYRWETGRVVPMFTIVQVKALSRMLKELKMSVDDLPDNLGPNGFT